MSTNRYFSLSRFGLLLKHDLLENWKSYVRSFCIIFLTALAVFYMALYTYSHLLSFANPYTNVDAYIRYQCYILAFAYSFYMLIKASQFTELLNTKEGRIRQLMFPATSLEKFISRALGVTVVPTILCIVAVLLADVVHFAFFPFFPNLPEEFKIWVVPEMWKNLWTSTVVIPPTGLLGTINSSHALYVILSALISHSFFILFGNIFDRNGFIAIVVVSCVVSFFRRSIYENTSVLYDSVLAFIYEYLGGFGTYLINGACFCLLIFIWWLSYKIFSRKQVIQPRFRL